MPAQIPTLSVGLLHMQHIRSLRDAVRMASQREEAVVRLRTITDLSEIASEQVQDPRSAYEAILKGHPVAAVLAADRDGLTQWLTNVPAPSVRDLVRTMRALELARSGWIRRLSLRMWWRISDRLQALYSAKGQ